MSQETASETEDGHNHWGIGGWLLFLAAFAIGFINFPLRVVGWRFDHLPGDALDNRINNFILEHGYRYLSGRADSFWDAPCFYPTRGVTACSDAHIGMLPLYSALRFVGFSPECAFQGWFVIPFVLNFASAAWALRRLGFNYTGVAVGSYVFAFGLPAAGQLVHAQLLPRFLVPAAVVFGWEFLRLPRLGRLAACCACTLYQLYISIYIGYFLVTLLACGAVIALTRYRLQFPRDLLRPGLRAWLGRIAVLTVSFLVLLPLFQAHHREVVGVAVEDIRALAPMPRGWITPPNASLATQLLTESLPSIEIEQKVFPGFLALLTVGLGLCTAYQTTCFGSRSSQVTVAAWSVFILALLITAFDGFWLYRPILSLPGVGGVRAIGRIVLVLLFPIAVVMAGFADRVKSWSRRRGRIASFLIPFATLAVVAADHWLSRPDGDCVKHWHGQRTSSEFVVARQDRIKNAVIKRNGPKKLIQAYPSDPRDLYEKLMVQFDAMRASQDLGMPCVNGYSGYLPFDWDYFSTRRDVLKWLKDQHAPPEMVDGLVEIDCAKLEPISVR